MNVVQLMVTIIIVTILVTVTLGIVSYAAYWLRRGRRPAQAEAVETEPRFFYRYRRPQSENAVETEEALNESAEAEPASTEPALAGRGA
jgi:Tfp pilus assembly protein PilE